MENITAEVIVELYAKYQLFNYWMNVGVLISGIFGMLTFFSIIGTAVADDKSASGFITTLMTALLIVGLIIRWKNLYQIEVVLKPEIARYVVPAGLDLADKVSQEVSAMWDILKGVLSK